MRVRSIDETIRIIERFYDENPYPGLGDKLLVKDAEMLLWRMSRPGKVLFPGCGTGHTMVAMGTMRRDLELYGVDLSANSLDIARQLAEKHDVAIELEHGDYTKPLPWSFRFQYIILQGTLHHVPEPSLALRNVVNYLEDGGLIFVNLYGKRYHRRRFEIIEILDLLQKNDPSKDLKCRFALFRAMQDKVKRKTVKELLLDVSPRVVWEWFHRAYHKLRVRCSKDAYSVPWTADFRELNQLWIDQYAHPYEKTFDIWDTKHLLESADLQVVEMLYLGKIRINELPELWQPIFEELDCWSQYRIMELYDPDPGSIYLWAKKKASNLL